MSEEKPSQGKPSPTTLGLCLLATLLLTALPMTVSPAAASGGPFERLEPPPGHELVLRAGYVDAHTRVPARPSIVHKLAPKTANFNVIYTGFPNNAKAAFQHAVDIWSSLITSPVTIRIDATWTSLEPGVLGSAGANNLWSDGTSIFPDALADALTGSDNGGGDFDIIARFNSDLPSWYLGTDGNPPSGRFDLVTVVLHEIGHGLGFFGGMFFDSGVGDWGFSVPVIYDQFTENLAGTRLVNMPHPSTALGNALRSGNVFFNGTMAVAANGGTRPELYAPSLWQSGSSYSHLDENVYSPGHPSSLMTPSLDPAEAIHDPGPVTLCLFKDIGWITAQNCGAVVETCTNSSTSVCLQDDRFQVEVEWRGNPPFDTLQPAFVSNLRTADSGIFYFLDPNNLEFLIKVLDVCSPPFNRFWVFFAATTDVEFTLTVTDTERGVMRQYFNNLGHPANAVTDTSAFDTCP